VSSTWPLLPLSPRSEHIARAPAQPAHTPTAEHCTALGRGTPGYSCFTRRTLIFTYLHYLCIIVTLPLQYCRPRWKKQTGGPRSWRPSSRGWRSNWRLSGPSGSRSELSGRPNGLSKRRGLLKYWRSCRMLAPKRV
jgi:hypothetical protein